MRSRLARLCTVTLLSLQLATWMIGVPVTRDRETARVIEVWKQTWRDRPAAALAGPYPHISTLVAFPILPGVIVAYEKCTFASLGGWDAWTLDLWWGSGSKRLGTWVTGSV